MYVENRMDQGRFQERVFQVGSGLPGPWLAWAAGEIKEEKRDAGSCSLEFKEADVQRAVGLARSAVVEAEFISGLEVPEEVGSVSAFSEEVRDRWLQAIDPLVSEVRKICFDSPEPPYSTEEAYLAEDWIVDQLDDLRNSVGPSSDDPGEKILTELGRSVAQYNQQTSSTYVLTPKPLELFFHRGKGPDGTIERVALPGFTSLQRPLTRPDPPDPPIVKIADLAEFLENPTGFHRADLVSYFLCGTVPRAERIWIRPLISSFPLIDGKKAVGARVRVDFLTPDVSLDDMVGLHKALKGMWILLGWKPELPNGKTGPRLTETDHQFLQVVRRIGEWPPRRPDANWWEHFDQIWRESGFELRKPDSHRVHWQRIRKKADKGLNLVSPGIGPVLKENPCIDGEIGE